MHFHRVTRTSSGISGVARENYKESMKLNYRDIFRAFHAEKYVEMVQRYDECTDSQTDVLEH